MTALHPTFFLLERDFLNHDLDSALDDRLAQPVRGPRRRVRHLLS